MGFLALILFICQPEVRFRIKGCLPMIFENFTIIDLTHSLSSSIPIWDNSCGFQLEIGTDNDEIVINTSAGTHIDAPAHFFKEKETIDTLSLNKLLAPACVIDVSEKATDDYAISLRDIQNYEAAYGQIEKGCLVVGHTGWSRHWDDAKAYRNVDANGEMHFPTFSIQAIEYLLSKRIVGIGIDSFAPEPIRFSNPSYPIHELLFKEEKYIIENMANCACLPPKGAYIIALPLKVQKAGEAPARVIALIPKKKE